MDGNAGGIPGHLRSIIGSMTVEAIIREHQTLADAIVDASKTEMARIGLSVDSLQISSIDGKGAGYIEALAAPHQVKVNQEAKVAQAAADQASALAQQESMRNQAEYARALVAQKNAELRQAELIAEVVRPAEAEAERITTLARARADATKLSLNRRRP